jgi:hypothetical protein
LSIVNVILPPGENPWPCTCKMPPSRTTLVPVIVRPGGLAGTNACDKRILLVAITTKAAIATMIHLDATPIPTFEVSLALEPCSREVCGLRACSCPE